MLEEIRDMICNYVVVDPAKITEDSLLRTDISMSSLDMINLAVEIEDTYDIQFPNNALLTMTTVGDLIKYIEENK